jgi:hypothetical protein
MKINELLNESFDNIEDPDTDKVPNIVMQIRKSMDTGGNRPIVFRDGTKVEIPVNAMIAFLNRYETLRPMDREQMQDLAVQSKEAFIDAVKNYNKPRAPKSIYT